jgi:AraC family transcriptional regulator
MNLIHPPGYLYGEYLRSSEIPDFKLAEGEYQRGMKTPHHSHEHALLCLVLRGAYIDTCRMKTRTHKQSTVFFLPPEEAHLSDFRSTSVRIFRIEVNPQRLERIREYSAVLDCPVDFDGGGLPRLAARLYGEFKRMDETSPLAIEGLILEMIAEASRSSMHTNECKAPCWLQQARELLHDRFAEKLSLAEIAQAVGVHPIYLASEFHRCYQSTIGEYVRRLRIEYACRQLSESDDSMVEIALQAGFSDQSHFCKVFKRLTGMTPRQYRASFRSPEAQIFLSH